MGLHLPKGWSRLICALTNQFSNTGQSKKIKHTEKWRAMQWNRWAPALSEQQAEPTSAVSPARSVPPHFAALNQSQISGCKQLRDRESISFASCCRQLPNCQNVEIWSKTSHCSSTCWALAVPQSLTVTTLWSYDEAKLGTAPASAG